MLAMALKESPTYLYQDSNTSAQGTNSATWDAHDDYMISLGADVGS